MRYGENNGHDRGADDPDESEFECVLCEDAVARVEGCTYACERCTDGKPSTADVLLMDEVEDPYELLSELETAYLLEHVA